MNRSQFLTTSFLLLILFLFLKIYQHNKMVKLLYNKQRIEREKEKLVTKKNDLLISLYKLQDQKLVKKRAEEELGMKPLRPSQIVVLSSIESGRKKAVPKADSVTHTGSDATLYRTS